MGCAEEQGSWRLDRRINLSTLISAGTCLAIAVSLIASLEVRLEGLEAKTKLLCDEVRESRRTVLQVERMDERICAMQRMLEEIKTELRREGRP